MAKIGVRCLVQWVRANWIYPVSLVLFGVAYAFHVLYFRSGNPRRGEIIAIAYWCLFFPSLVAFFVRDRPVKKLAIRVLAVACGGIWLAGLTVPDHAKQLLTQWGWMRYVGLALLTLVEIQALVILLKILLGRSDNQADLERAGMPPFAAKLMMAEARFWRRVWGWAFCRRAK